MLLPLELTLEILDLLQARGETEVLLVCALVCREWYERCQDHLYETVRLRTRQQLYLLRRSLQKNALLRQLVYSLAVLNSALGADALDLDIVFVVLASMLPNLRFLYCQTIDAFPIPGTLRVGPRALQYASQIGLLHSLVLYYLHFETLAIFGRFIFAFPSLVIIVCTHVTALSRGGERVVEGLMSRRLKLRMLIMNTNDIGIMIFLLQTSRRDILHLSICVRTPWPSDFSESLQPMAKLEELSITFNDRTFTFGDHEVNIIRTLCETTPATLAGLTVDLAGCGAIPTLVADNVHIYSRLRQLDDFLTSSRRLADVTFVIPSGAVGRAMFWDRVFHECFSGLEGSRRFSIKSSQRDNVSGILLSAFVQNQWTNSEGHNDRVTSLVLSPNSKLVASGCDLQSIIILWDAEDGSILAKWATTAGPPRDLAFSCDSRRLACLARSIVVWNVESAQVLGVLEPPSNTVYWAVAWSPDGQQLASGSDGGAIRIWDARTYKRSQLLQDHHEASRSVQFVVYSSDGKLLASCRADHRCCIWEVDTGALKYTLHDPDDFSSSMIWAAAFDHNSRRIATVSITGTVHIWSLSSGNKLLTVGEHSRSTRLVAFTEDGKHIILGSSAGTFTIHDTSNGKLILSIYHDGCRMDMAQCSPDGKYIASASVDGTVWLWNRSDGTCAATLAPPEGDIHCVNGRGHVVFPPHGRTLISTGGDGRVYVRKLSDYV